MYVNAKKLPVGLLSTVLTRT
ncbi:conserved protein of unknown function [Bradyrhizobium sp. ORS 285]|nr:hypothetical protein BRAO285_2000013 [Bradyrhizobium sp. ORS 285]SMX61702.1 conserved protein of unknown function [Bradyrhizobium sp. ORS 285]